MMSGWLTDWGLNQTDTGQTRMAWMTGPAMRGPAMPGHSSRSSTTSAAAPDGTTGTGASGMRLLPDGRMPGMASNADITRLQALRGPAADVLWLQTMVVHHRGGVDMARTALALTDRPAVRQLAQSIVDSQSAEINQMQDMLRKRGAAPACRRPRGRAGLAHPAERDPYRRPVVRVAVPGGGRGLVVAGAHLPVLAEHLREAPYLGGALHHRQLAGAGRGGRAAGVHTGPLRVAGRGLPGRCPGLHRDPPAGLTAARRRRRELDRVLGDRLGAVRDHHRSRVPTRPAPHGPAVR